LINQLKKILKIIYQFLIWYNHTNNNVKNWQNNYSIQKINKWNLLQINNRNDLIKKSLHCEISSIQYCFTTESKVVNKWKKKKIEANKDKFYHK
jgi:hypothetical protein